MLVSIADDDVRYVPDEQDTPGDMCSIAHETRYQWVLQNIDLTGKSVLDFGCGSGYGSHLLASKAVQVMGVDISATAIAYAQTKYSEDNCRFAVADLETEQVVAQIDSRFDVLVSFDVIEHVEKYWAFVENARRLLKPGGVAIIGCPNRLATLRINREWNPFHVQEFTPVQLQWLLARSFSQVEVLGQFVANEDKQLADFTQEDKIPRLKRAVVVLAKELTTPSLRQSAKKLLRVIRKEKTASASYTLADIGFAPIDLLDQCAMERPFGLMAVCR